MGPRKGWSCQGKPQTVGGGLIWGRVDVLVDASPGCSRREGPRDNIQVLTKDMHAEPTSPQYSPSFDSFCIEKEVKNYADLREHTG